MAETEHLEKATLAGGCFWCMEPPFVALEGVVSTMPGYADGHVENPSPHFSPPFVARRFKGAVCLVFVTEERAGILDSLSSTPTERTPGRACHWAVAVEGW